MNGASRSTPRFDLAQSHENLHGGLDRRNTPARIYFVWPLGVGATWEQTYRYERPAANLDYDVSYIGGVEAEETITVPAGTFKTLKIVLRGAHRKTVFDERWYSADARMWVRMRFPAEEAGVETRELLEYRLAGTTGQAPASQSQARAAKVTDTSTSSSSR